MVIQPNGMLGKYRLVRLLGKGGMGEVYLAEDSALGRLVALKILPSELVHSSRSHDQFFREAKSIAAIAHPNIVHINAFDVIEGMPVLEMEYVSGGSLRDRLARAAITPHQAVRFAHGLASGLNYCHRQGIVHRDVKPANVLLDKLGHVKLADFGVAKLVSGLGDEGMSLTQTGIFKGTPQYAPPEAWEGTPPTARWDIYGLGAILYECLSGTTPYEGGTPLQLARRIATTNHAPLKEVNPTISGALATLVDEMLTRNPVDRVSDAELVCERLEAVPEYYGQASYSGDVTIQRSTRSRPRPRRRRVFIAWVALALLLLAAGVVVVGGALWTPGTTAPTVNPGTAGADPAAAAPASRDSLLVVEEHVARYDTPRLSRWLVRQGEDGVPSKLYGHSLAHLLVADLEAVGEEGTYRVQGNWSGYIDRGGTILRTGEVSGRLQSTTGRKALAGALTYVNEQDGTVQTSTLAGVSESTVAAAQDFLLSVEADRYVAPLLNNELLPRRAEVGLVYDALLPAASTQRTVATVREAIHVDALQIDGQFDEEAWLWATTDLKAAAGSAEGATLDVLPAPERLAFAIHVPVEEAPKDVSLVFEVKGNYTLPPAVIRHVRVGFEDNTWAAVLVENGEQSRPLPDACEAAAILAGSIWQAELVLARAPLEEVGVLLPAQTRLRIRCVLSVPARGGERKTLAMWGHPEAAALAHGALLELVRP